MAIIIIIFLGLMVVLFFAFANFDKLVKIEYRKYREKWVKDGKPRGFFWWSSESNSFASSIAMQIRSMQWLFKTPNWVADDFEARGYLRKLRLSVLIWNIGIIVWFIVSITTHKINIP